MIVSELLLFFINLYIKRRWYTYWKEIFFRDGRREAILWQRACEVNLSFFNVFKEDAS
jgi:hypothetical protein